jgi:hypothetical protein
MPIIKIRPVRWHAADCRWPVDVLSQLVADFFPFRGKFCATSAPNFGESFRLEADRAGSNTKARRWFALTRCRHAKENPFP